MVRKYHNHKVQTNPWHLEEKPHNNHETPERQTYSHMEVTKRINNNRPPSWNGQQPKPHGGLNAFY